MLNEVTFDGDDCIPLSVHCCQLRHLGRAMPIQRLLRLGGVGRSMLFQYMDGGIIFEAKAMSEAVRSVGPGWYLAVEKAWLM